MRPFNTGDCLIEVTAREGFRGGPLPKIGKNMIFWRKIVIFHTKYPKNVRASLRSAQFFLSVSTPPQLEILDPPLGFTVSICCRPSYTYFGSRVIDGKNIYACTCDRKNNNEIYPFLMLKCIHFLC